jgi:ATP-dependent Lhr-like helicase
LRGAPRPAAVDRLVRQHDLDAAAAETLLRYLDDQAAAGAVPDDRTIVIERCLDELGDWRVCLLSPFGSRIHAPWAMAVTAEIRTRTGMDVEVMWGDEGFVIRFPETETPPDPALLIPDVEEVEALVVRQLGSTSLFAARFRETASRALLLPRRRPGTRTPLWQQRKRASDLLAVASRFGSFPALLETYREVLRDHFDMPALVETLRKIGSRTLRVVTIDSRVPSPFAASLLFSYVANYIYDGDAPLAERRAQALSVDQAQLRELLGDAELRELLDPAALDTIERQLQHLDEPYKARTADGLHDLLIRIGDLTLAELTQRSALPDTPAAVRDLERARRIVALPVAGEPRFVAVEDVARYRDALGIPLPAGLPEALLEAVRDAPADLALRYARSHGPFTAREMAARYGIGPAVAESLLQRIADTGRVIEGEFRPGGAEREWVEAGVLRSLRRRSLAKLRHEIEPVDADALGRFLVSWHGIGTGRRGLETLLDAVEQLQGAAIPASMLEAEVLPARVEDYEPRMLDELMAAGEVTWVGVEPLGDRDGRLTLYLTDHLPRLRPPARVARRDGPAAGDKRPGAPDAVEGRAAEILEYLGHHGASFFSAIHEGSGGGFPRETVDALWDLAWRGLVTNDTLHALRAFTRALDARAARRRRGATFRSRRLVPPKAEGRWSLVPSTALSVTEWSATSAQQLLTRHGIVTRETVAAEAVAGGFSAVYQVLKAMEDAGRIRRGYFVAGLGAAQFAMPSALDLLRSMRERPDEPRTVVLAATDPANPYGTVVKWPEFRDPGSGVRDPKSGVREPGSAIGDRGSEIGDRGSGIRDQGSQRGGRRSGTQSGDAGPRIPDSGSRIGGPTRTVGARVIIVDGFLVGYLRRGERELLLFLPDDEPQRSQFARETARMLLHLAVAREEAYRGMLLAEINGGPAAAHPASRVFIEEGFIATAMGLQARLRSGTRGLRSAGGIGIAGAYRGGSSMAEAHRSGTDLVDNPLPNETRDIEHDRIRTSNDRDQEAERDGEVAPHNQGYDDAVRGIRTDEDSEDVDPDSAESDVDREDTKE